jgi:outer membrane protein TolC
MVRKLPCLFLFCLVLTSSCAFYHPLPLDADAEAKALAPPDWDKITLSASSISHPLLKPLAIDLADGLSPEEAAVAAVIANPRLRVIRDQRGIAEAQVMEAGLIPNPQISYEKDTPTAGDYEGAIAGTATALSWDGLLSLVNRSLRKKSAKAEAASVELDIAYKEWQVAEEARMAVYRLYLLEKALPPAKELSDNKARILSALEEAEKSGDASGAVVAGARDALDNARREELYIVQSEEEARTALNSALGLPPQADVPLEKELSLPEWQNIPEAEALVVKLSERRLDLLALKKGYESEDANLRLMIREQFSPIAILANYAKDTSNVITYGLGAALEIPFFNRNQGNIAMAGASRRELYDEYCARLFDARAEVSAIRGSLANLSASLESARSALPSLKSSADALGKEMERGNASLFVFDEARSAAIEKEILVLSLQSELAQAGLALEVASGEYLPANETSINSDNKEKP